MEICHQMAFGFQTVGVAGSRSSTGGMFAPPREFNRSTDRELNDRRRKKKSVPHTVEFEVGNFAATGIWGQKRGEKKTGRVS